MNDNLLFLSGNDIDQLLSQEDQNILEIVKQAYLTHHQGHATLPPSTFLRFPDKERERIISLPAYLGEPFNCAGIKWISSFPENVHKNMERASAIFVLNSLETGHPIAVLESSIISAKRTAAGAALTAHLVVEDKHTIEKIAVVGTGLINFETTRFLLHLFHDIKSINVYDMDPARAQQFKEVINRIYPSVEVIQHTALQDAINAADVISIATTAVKPYIEKLEGLKPSTIILHTSLRDLAPEIILSANNIVDDINHACSANTSLQLASQIQQSTDFINCTIGQLIEKGKEKYVHDQRPIIASPFGMGTLDLALANFLYQKALNQGIGFTINQFIPQPWFKKTA